MMVNSIFSQERLNGSVTEMGPLVTNNSTRRTEPTNIFLRNPKTIAKVLVLVGIPLTQLDT